ncbi:hypothetical protein Btru_027135 [Bulinus truncatus]|nr:hypothetical protein Btru_027135 [Bulinus truncatus]
MNPSSSLTNKKKPAADTPLLPPKQTEWRKYSKTLIDELKEKLEDRRTKTLALLSESQDLSAFREIDTESDGLDDTSTNATSRHERQSCDNPDLTPPEQMLATSSLSETSLLTDSDCCDDDDDDDRRVKHRCCPFAVEMAGCDGVCTRSSYSTTSSIETDEMSGSKSAKLSPPPPQGSAETMTSHGRERAFKEHEFISGLHFDICDDDKRHGCDCLRGCPCGQEQVTAEYMVRRSSSHCVLNVSTSLAVNNASVRLTQSFTDLRQGAEFDMHLRMTSSKVSYFAEITAGDPKAPFDKQKDFSSVDREHDMKDSTEVGTFSQEEISVKDKLKEEKEIEELICCSPVPQCEEIIVKLETEHAQGESIVMPLDDCPCTASGQTSTYNDGNADVVVNDLTRESSDKINHDSKSFGTEPTNFMLVAKQLDPMLKENLRGDKELLCNAGQQQRDQGGPAPSASTAAASDRLSPNYKWKNLLEEIYNTINDSIMEDIDKTIMTGLKLRLSLCSPGLNVSSNSGYQASSQRGDICDDKRSPGDSPAESGNQQLKTCLEKVHLASTLQKRMALAKSSVASMAAKRAYETAIGDFDNVMGDFLKANSPQDSQLSKDQTALTVALRRSDTFVIDKDWHLEHSPTPKIEKNHSSRDSSDVSAAKHKPLDSFKESRDEMQNTLPEYRGYDLPPKFSPTYYVSQKATESKRKKKRRKSKSKGEKIGQFLTGNKMLDTNTFVLKHFHSGSSMDSASDSSDSPSETPPDASSCKYTSSMLAQLLDYDSQEEKPNERVEKTELESELELNSKNIDTQGLDDIRITSNSNEASIPAGVVITVDSDNLTCSNKLDGSEVKPVLSHAREVADDDYESDFNAGSISECIQEEEKSDDKDSDLGLNFKTDDKKDVDSATFNVDRPVESQDCSDIELTMNEDIPAITGQTNLVTARESDVEMSDLCEDLKCLIETQGQTDADLIPSNVKDSCEEFSVQKEEQERDILVFPSTEEMFAIPELSDLFNKEDINDDAFDEEEKPKSLIVKNTGECQVKMDMSNEAENLPFTKSGNFSAEKDCTLTGLTNKYVIKMADGRPSDSGRSPFIPMVEWSSSEEDIFEDLARDKSPSDILRQKQKELVDEKLKQLTQISKRRRKSRSPVSYKLAEKSVNLQMILRNALNEDNGSAALNLDDTASTSQTFGHRRLFAVLKSPVELGRDPCPVQPSVSDLLLARISEEDTNIGQRGTTGENDQSLQTEVYTTSGGAFETSRLCDVKCPTHMPRLNRSAESSHRFAGVSTYTAQSPKKATILCNSATTNVTGKPLSSQTASTEHTSMSSTSGEYNFPDNVALARNKYVGVWELTESSCNTDKARDVPASKDVQIAGENPCIFGSIIAKENVGSFKQPIGRYGSLEKNENVIQAPHSGVKAVDNVIREVKASEPVISGCGAQQLLLTAVTEGGPSVVCETKDVDVGECLEGTAVSELRDQLSKILNCVRPRGEHIIRDRPPVRVRRASVMEVSAAANEFDDQECLGPPLYPTPNSQVPSHSDRYDVEEDVAVTDDGENCGAANNWTFVGDVDNFNLYLEATREIKNQSQCVFKVINPEYEKMNISQTGRTDCRPRDREEVEDTGKNCEDNVGNTSGSHRRKPAGNGGGNLPSGQSKQRTTTASSFFETNTNAEVKFIEESHNVRSDLLQSLLDKITTLEGLVSQSQQSVYQQPWDSASPQAPKQVDPILDFPLFLQRGPVTGHHGHHSRMPASIPFLCPCHVHDYPGHSVPRCHDYFGMCGLSSNRVCPGVAHPAVGGLTETTRHIIHSSTSSQTEAPSDGSDRPVKTKTASTQCQPQELSFAEMYGRCGDSKQTRQIGFQTELDQEKCSCLQQCLSSIDNLESLDNRLHRELVDCVHSLKKDTETMVNGAYDRMTRLLGGQLNEALDKTNQTVSLLINTYNQSLTQQLADVNKNMAAIQHVQDAASDSKGQTTKRGMDYDTLKMRVVELTSQRDAEKVFHKITRESLRALERDHDRLRQEYVRATYRRLNHNSESEVRQRVYHLLNEPDDLYRYGHRHDKGHHSKYASRRAADDVGKFYAHADESHPGRHRTVHSSNTFKDLTQKNTDPNAACPETSKAAKTHRKDKRAKHFGSRAKEAFSQLDMSADSGNNQSSVCEVVNENCAVCQVELRPSRLSTGNGATFVKDNAHPRGGHFENKTTTDNSQTSEREVRDEAIFQKDRSASGRHGSTPNSGNASLFSAVNKDDRLGQSQMFLDVAIKECKTQEVLNVRSDSVVDPGTTESKSSLSLSNESF